VKTCGNCRFWSQMCAQSIGCGPVEAICLGGKASKFAGKFMRETQTCDAWKSNHHGQVDDPPDYGEQVRALYEAEEARQP
jgi:hypothetical protein